MKKVKVKCSYVVEVELPDDFEMHTIQFAIEENSCPGTGVVGGALYRMLDQHEETGTCWACALGGENKIISIDGVPYVD